MGGGGCGGEGGKGGGKVGEGGGCAGEGGGGEETASKYAPVSSALHRLSLPVAALYVATPPARAARSGAASRCSAMIVIV